MKLRSSIVAFFGVLSFIVFPLFQNHVEMDYYEIVTKSFATSNAEKTALIIKGWAKINLTELNEGPLKKEFLNTTKQLGIPFKPTMERYSGFNKAYQIHDIGSALIEISLQSYSIHSPHSGTELEIIITLEPNCKDSEKYYSMVMEIFAPYSKADIGITLIGTFDGFLTDKHQLEIINNAFQSIDAKVVEGINTERLVSYSGYTESCQDYLMVAGKKINISIGIRYHILNDKTYLNIGAPLIFQEY